MKITYLESPTSLYKLHTYVSSILTENLSRNNKLDVTYNYSILKNNSQFDKLHNKVLKTEGNNSILNYCKHKFFAMRNYSVLAPFQSNVLESYADSIKTEVVLITCWTSFSFPFIKILLEKGKRVVMGGTVCNLFSFSEIRQMLRDLETPEHLLLNLIIIKGYVDLDTDLYKIMFYWKDYEITNNNFKTFWNCTNDYVKKLRFMYDRYNIENIWYTILFSNDCWYKKCTFCNVENVCTHNFIEDADEDTIYNMLITNIKDHGSSTLYIDDPYFVFDNKKEKIIQKLRSDGVLISITTGIHLLQKEIYLNKINKYADKVLVGLESTSDFALSYINKGYGWSEIDNAVNQMISYLNKNICIKLYCIHDLVMKDRADVISNYVRLHEVRCRLRDAGFKESQYYPSMLYLFNSASLARNQKHLKVVNNHKYSNSGVWRIFEYLESIGIDVNIPKQVVLPFQRLDIDGNILPSDLDIVPQDLFHKTISW